MSDRKVPSPTIAGYMGNSVQEMKRIAISLMIQKQRGNIVIKVMHVHGNVSQEIPLVGIRARCVCVQHVLVQLIGILTTGNSL